jgi:repressor LexA
MKNLPPRQQEVFNFISEYHQTHGFAPVYKEIADGLGLSSSTIIAYVDILKRKGAVRSLPGIPRSLTIIPDAVPLEVT